MPTSNLNLNSDNQLPNPTKQEWSQTWTTSPLYHPLLRASWMASVWAWHPGPTARPHKTLTQWWHHRQGPDQSKATCPPPSPPSTSKDKNWAFMATTSTALWWWQQYEVMCLYVSLQKARNPHAGAVVVAVVYCLISRLLVQILARHLHTTRSCRNLGGLEGGSERGAAVLRVVQGAIFLSFFLRSRLSFSFILPGWQPKNLSASDLFASVLVNSFTWPLWFWGCLVGVAQEECEWEFKKFVAWLWFF